MLAIEGTADSKTTTLSENMEETIMDEKEESATVETGKII